MVLNKFDNGTLMVEVASGAETSQSTQTIGSSPMNPDSTGHVLQRGDWIGVTMLLVLAIVGIWRSWAAERKRTDETTAAIQANTAALERNAEKLAEFCAEVKRTSDHATQLNQKMIDAFLEAIRQRHQ